jgi:hypothetical protein
MSLVLSAIRGSLSSKAKQWLERTRVRLMRSGSVRRFVVDPPPHQTPSLALPLFPVKKFNGQEMDGRTLKVEIAKAGAPAAKTAGQQRRAQRSLLERRSGGVSLTTRDELRGDRPSARRVDTQAMRRS